MPPLGLPRLSVDPVGFWAFWLGGLRDYSGFGNHGTNFGCRWGTRGASDQVHFAGTDMITVLDSPELRLTAGTLAFWGDFNLYRDFDRLIQKRDAGGHNYGFYSSNITNLTFTDGTNASAATVAYAGSKFLAVSFESGSKPKFYKDRAFAAEGSLVVTVTPDDADLTIGNQFQRNKPQSNPLNAAVVYPAALSAPELAELFDYSQSRITPRKQWPGSGLRYPGRETNLLVDGDMKAADTSAWVPLNAADLSKVDTDGHRWLDIAHDGGNNPGAAQDPVVVIGQSYRVSGVAAGSGVSSARVIQGGVVHWLGVPSTAEQPFDEMFIAAANNALFLSSTLTAAGSVRFRNVKLWTRPPGYTPRTGDLMWRANTQSARVSLDTEASGRLSNTDFEIITGSYELTESASGRTITCITDGRLQPLSNNPGADGWDTSVFEQTGGVVLMKNAANFTIDMTAGDTFTALELTAP